MFPARTDEPEQRALRIAGDDNVAIAGHLGGPIVLDQHISLNATLDVLEDWHSVLRAQLGPHTSAVIDEIFSRTALCTLGRSEGASR